MNLQFVLGIWQVLKATFRSLARNDVTRMAGATAFFTTFALPPILMIIVRTLGLFIGKRAVGRALMGPLRSLFGNDSANSVIQTIRSFKALEHNYLIASGIFIFLLFVATSLFSGIRHSINQIWGVRVSQKAGVRELIKSRAISVLVILVGGVLFLGVQILEAEQHFIGEHVQGGDAQASLLMGNVCRIASATFISALWFYLLFSLLPDGRPTRRTRVAGACVTGIMLTVGKALLRILLQPGQITSFYGVSGAIALVLLFMFYSSLILYFGAALIRATSDASQRPILPKEDAEMFRVVTVEQPSEKELSAGRKLIQ